MRTIKTVIISIGQLIGQMDLKHDNGSPLSNKEKLAFEQKITKALKKAI